MLRTDHASHIQIERDRVLGIYIALTERENQFEEFGADLEL